MRNRERLEIKTPDQIRQMRRAGQVVADIHAALREAVRPGITTAELDAVSAGVIEAAGAGSNFLGYEGYPATVCISVNDEVVHGIPGPRVLEVGDLVTFDCGAYVTDASGTQWHGDAAFTAVVGGRYASQEDRILDEATFRSLWTAVAALAHAMEDDAAARPGTAAHRGGRRGRLGGADRSRRLNCVGDAVESVVAQVAQESGVHLGILEDYVGHGIGTAMHMEPDVYNYAVRGRLERLRPGMVLAVEPMLTGGSALVRELEDGWTVVTEDGSRSAQWEHTVALVPGGVWVLTASDGGVVGLAPFGITPKPLD